MADEEAPAADMMVTADGHPESDEGAPMEVDGADHEIAAEAAANANGVAEADPQPVEAAAEAATEAAGEAPRERSSKHASRREDEDNPRERRRDDAGAFRATCPFPSLLRACLCMMPMEKRAVLSYARGPDVRRAALWHAVNVWACPRQTCERADGQILLQRCAARMKLCS